MAKLPKLIDQILDGNVQHAADALSFVNKIRLYFLITRFCESSENLRIILLMRYLDLGCLVYRRFESH